MVVMPLAFAVLLFATGGGTPPPELDALPAALREQAALIFVAKYTTHRGEPVSLGRGEEAWVLRGVFDVEQVIFGNVPEHIEVNPAELKESEHVEEARGGHTYLVLMDADKNVQALVLLGPKADRVEITDFGTFVRDDDAPQLDAPDTTSGYIHVVDAETTPSLIERTDHFDAEMGTVFGALFLAESRDAADNVVENVAPIRIRVLHPPVTDPDTGRTATRDEWDAPANLGIVRYTGFRFEKACELVPGTWTIEILQRGVVMARKEFTITVIPTKPN